MTDLIPLCALAGPTPRIERYGAVTIEETPSLALASLALRRGAARPAPFGLALPGPGGWVQSGDVAASWLGPDQWLVEGEGRANEDFSGALAAAAPGCSVTEQTDGWVAFEIVSSEGAAPLLKLLARLVNIDPSRLAPSMAARTGLEHMNVLVIRRAEDRLAVLGMRSMAESLSHALAKTARRLDRGNE